MASFQSVILSRDEVFPDFFAKRILVPLFGTPVQLPATTIAPGALLSIRALPTNKKNIFVANSSANTAVVADRISLSKGEVIKLRINNVNLVWIDSEVNITDGVEILVEQE